jgi:hypothetical protein
LTKKRSELQNNSKTQVVSKLKEILFAGTFLTIIFVMKQVLATIPNVQLVVFLMTLFFLHAK